MERRNVLLGGGAALATILAGCSSDETSDDTGSNSPTDDESDEDGTGTEGEPDETDKTGDKDKTDEDKAGDNDDPADDEIPGFERDEFELDSETVSVSTIEREGEIVTIVVDTETTDEETLAEELKSFADDVDEGIVDLETFTDHIETIALFIKHDGEKVVSYGIAVQWITEYREGSLTRAELLEKIRGTETTY